jgi:hypothetical protein
MPQRITHHRRLADASGDVSYFFEAAAALGEAQPHPLPAPPYAKDWSG